MKYTTHHVTGTILDGYLIGGLFLSDTDNPTMKYQKQKTKYRSRLYFDKVGSLLVYEENHNQIKVLRVEQGGSIVEQCVNCNYGFTANRCNMCDVHVSSNLLGYPQRIEIAAGPLLRQTSNVGIIIINLLNFNN